MPRDEVELAKAAATQTVARTQAAQHLLTWPLRILAVGIVALCIYPSVQALAGRQTGVNIGIAISVSIGINVAQGFAMIYLRNQLREERRRREEAERRLKALKSGGGARRGRR